MNIQIIERDGNPEYAVVPFAEFERLREAAETLDEIHSYDQAMQQITVANEETFPIMPRLAALFWHMIMGNVAAFSCWSITPRSSSSATARRAARMIDPWPLTLQIKNYYFNLQA